MYTLTRDHLDKKAGEKVFLTDDQLTYYIRVGLVKPVEKNIETIEVKRDIGKIKRGRRKANGDT